MMIQTFIFLDLETTGLIEGKNMPRITEIALVAIARESLCTSNKNSLPRVLHKLVLPVNPRRIIPPRVEYLTKLSNEDMQLLQPFECGIYELIIHFLQRLKPPICLVAHNGNNFDYPVFLWEFKCINKILDDRILCVDTWKIFQDFFRRKQNSSVQYSLKSNSVEDLLNDEYNESLSAMLDVVMMEEEEVKEIQDIDVYANEVHNAMPAQAKFYYKNRNTKVINGIENRDTKIINDIGNRDIKVINDKCIANKQHDNVSSQSWNSKQKSNEKTPQNQIIKLKNVCAERPLKKINNSRRRLDFAYDRPVNLKLPAIYEHMFGSNFTSMHSAEADCLAMIRCVTQIADFFLEWSDNNAVPLACCEKT